MALGAMKRARRPAHRGYAGAMAVLGLEGQLISNRREADRGSDRLLWVDLPGRPTHRRPGPRPQLVGDPGPLSGCGFKVPRCSTLYLTAFARVP